jgi:D-tyrosyl-tRNA(Tyr) deacylase
MRAVVQRVSRASVIVAGAQVATIARGFLVLVGVGRADDERDAAWLADKVVGLRAFPDEQGQMNLALADVGGEMLVVSQFTLLGDCRKGRRPSYSDAAEPAAARRLYALFVERLRALGPRVAEGVFGAIMDVTLTNDGPVTLLLDSKRLF